MCEYAYFLGEEDFLQRMEEEVRPLLSAKLREGSVLGHDGVELYYAYLPSEQKRGTVVISHGFCEFIGKYHEMMYYYHKEGYDVYFLAHRGHGKSGGRGPVHDMVVVEHFEDYVKDFECFMKNVVLADHPARPLTLFGHSMGGAIAAIYLSRHADVFDKAILSSPMIRLLAGKVPIAAAKVAVWAGITAGGKQEFSPGQHGFVDTYDFENSSGQSEARYTYQLEMRKADADYQTFGGSRQWVKEALRASALVKEHVDRITTPILFLSASLDAKVSPEAEEEYAALLPDARFIKFPTSKHEIFNATDQTRELYYHTIFMFLAEK